MDPIFKVILFSSLPISEIRGGIPVGIANNLPVWQVVTVAILTNIFIIIPLFFFLNYLHHIFLRIKLYDKLFNFYIERKRHKAKKIIDKWGYPGLLFFVAIPLPFTGAYTGALVAWILGLDQKKAFWYIALGVTIAAVIVTIVSVLSIGNMNFMIKEF
jgi:uncharacterized membrane protein